MVFFGDCAKFGVRSQILQIGLDDWLPRREDCAERVFPLDDLIDNLVRTAWSSNRRLRDRQPRSGRSNRLHGGRRCGLRRGWGLLRVLGSRAFPKKKKKR